MHRVAAVVLLGLMVAASWADGMKFVWPELSSLGGGVGAMITVESGQPFGYTITCGDTDAAQPRGQDGKHELVYVPDVAYWVNDKENHKPLILSSRPGWKVTLNGVDPDTGMATYDFTGVAWPSEQTAVRTDTWWFDDEAKLGPGDVGDRDDPPLGPLVKCIYMTPNCGWVYGTVLDHGGEPVRCKVALYRGGEPVLSSAATEAHSDAAGLYSIHLIEPGDYELVVNGDVRGRRKVSVKKGEGTLAYIVVQRPGIE